MENLTNGVINVHVNPKDKEEATNILKDLGLNMTRKAVPFEISTPNFSEELEDSLKETIEIEKEFKSGKRKGYNNANEMLRSIIDDWF